MADDESMVPIDMRGFGRNIEVQEHLAKLVKTLGPKGAAEGYVAAAKFFEEN